MLSDSGRYFSGMLVLKIHSFQKFKPISIALVISPLISLMEDQIMSEVSPIRGAYLSSSQTREEKEEILKRIKELVII